jgi:hypothetical protein
MTAGLRRGGRRRQLSFCQGLQSLTSTALTRAPTVMVAGPVTLLLSMMWLVLVDDSSA